MGGCGQCIGRWVEVGRIKDYGCTICGINDQTDNDGSHIKDVARVQTRISIPLGAEYLAYLEGIIASTTIECGNRTIVIGNKLVITPQTIDDQACIDVLIVVDPLDLIEIAATG